MFRYYGSMYGESQPQYGNGIWVTTPELVVGDEVIFTNATGVTHTMRAYKDGGEVVVDVPNQMFTVVTPILVQIKGYPESKTGLSVYAHDKPEDYVLIDNTKQKNHPDCIVVEPAKTVTVPIVMDEEIGMYTGIVENAQMVVGEKHAVIVDGVVYECVAIGLNGGCVMGNLALAEPDNFPDTGEPFIFTQYDSIFGGFVTNGASKVTIRIPEKVEPIAPQYMGGVTLPHVKLTTEMPESGEATLTAEESAQLDVAVATKLPVVITFPFEGVASAIFNNMSGAMLIANVETISFQVANLAVTGEGTGWGIAMYEMNT